MTSPRGTRHVGSDTSQETSNLVTFSIPNMTCGGRAKGVLVAPGAPTVDLNRREARVYAAGIAPLIAALRAGEWNAALHG